MLRDRVSKLSAASLRISASLDLDTVLSEVVESARVLTGARYGVITTIGDSGQAEDFVSSGFTPDEHRQIRDWADGPRLFEHFRDLEGALRVSDIPSYVRSLGLSPHPILPKTVQGTPMRHRSVNVGNFFLAGKAGGREFTSEDEEVLVLFAAQAATAIANARTYRDEHRARADLEALVNTSPVGVAVFNARTGQPVLINREAEADCGRPGRARSLRGAVAGGHEVPARRRTGDLIGRVSPGAGAEQRHDGARRGDGARGPGRSERHHFDQRHADPFRGWCDRVGSGHPAGHGAAGGAGTVANTSF